MRADEIEDITFYQRNLHEPIMSFPEIAQLPRKALTSIQGRVTSVSTNITCHIEQNQCHMPIP